MEPATIFILLIGVTLAEFVFSEVLDFLNIRHKPSKLPSELSGVYEADKYAKSLAYQKENYRFGLIQSVLGLALILFLLFNDGFAVLDRYLVQFTEDPVGRALLFFGTLYIASDLLSTPFSLYKTFVIEEKYGFNKTTPVIYLTDKVKGYVLSLVVGGVLVGGLLWLILGIGPYFWVYFWVVITVFILFVNLFYTSLILPLFNKLTPLETGELRNAIEAYCKSVNFPLSNLFVMDGSKRSAKANAFFSGIGKQKKVVLYDTLIENHTQDELVAVLAHEVGHYKKKHIVQSLFFSVLQMGLTMFLLSLFVFNENLSLALGSESLSIHLNLIAFGILYSPISTLAGLAFNLISRKNEFEADSFAKETFGAAPLQAALKKLSGDNLSNLTPHPAYVFFNYSHPPLLQRLRNLAEGK